MVSVNLPQELVEEILHRTPPLSLARFRAVCKRWNSLFDDSKFVEYHLHHSQPQFIFQIDYNIYSVSVDFNDLQIEVYELPLKIPFEDCGRLTRIYPELKRIKLMNYVDCDGLLFCSTKNKNKLLVWNPWLRETKILQIGDTYTMPYVIGYDNNKRYKLFVYGYEQSWIYEIGLDSVKVQDLSTSHSTTWSIVNSNMLSLNGTLYWAAVDVNNSIFIRSYCFSTERSTKFCRVPYKYEEDNVLALAVYRKDRLSLLNLCNESSTITVWLTKNSITNNTETGVEEDVVWLKLTTVLIPNFPKFSLYLFNRPDLTYFLDNEDARRLVICCYDKTDHNAYIYIVRGGVMLKKIRVYHYNALIDNDPYELRDYLRFPKLRTYNPSLVRSSRVNEDNK